MSNKDVLEPAARTGCASLLHGRKISAAIFCGESARELPSIAYINITLIDDNSLKPARPLKSLGWVEDNQTNKFFNIMK